MYVNRRNLRPTLLAAAIGISLAVAVAGCLGSSHPNAASGSPLPSSPTPTKSHSPIPPDLLPRVAGCMRAHGVKVATDAKAKEVKNAFKGLSAAQRQSVFAACGPLLPPDIRQAVQQRMGQATSPTP